MLNILKRNYLSQVIKHKLFIGKYFTLDVLLIIDNFMNFTNHITYVLHLLKELSKEIFRALKIFILTIKPNKIFM